MAIPGPFGWTNKLSVSTVPFSPAHTARLRSSIPDFDTMGVAIVDVSGSTPFGYATNFTKTGFAASLVKIVAMYSAFYLQDRLRSMIGTFGGKSLTNIEAMLRKEWRAELKAKLPRSTGDFPDISKIFGSTAFAFSTSFAKDMDEMMKHSKNLPSGRCIRSVGYDYINAVLIHGGFYSSADKSGFWLAGDYTPATHPSNREGAMIPGMGTSQAASAKAVSLLLANLARNELISLEASAKMKTVMNNAISWIAPEIQKAHPHAEIWNKIGVHGSVHDCAIVKYSNAHYAYCALFSKGSGIVPLFVELDKLAQELFAVRMVAEATGRFVRSIIH